ncbi:hypothetical protein DEO23_05660 [Brachybacterium endophyticum]|uniref:Asparagine synthetase domain-containing protein n=1 Tax=Brachybacterium endophyticum TaxID=2182385 RepID=A0A2U2RKU3_9MICO|nr:hypothetical protein DEO23_05660 [Brachybacterium endophyticum]
MNFGVAALSEKGKALFSSLWSAAVELGSSAYGLEKAVSVKTDSRGLLNARATEGTWSVPGWLEDERGVLSLSQPPVSVTQSVTLGNWEAWARETLRSDQGRATVQPGYFGLQLGTDGSFEAWNDTFGFGRSYVVRNEHFVAVGNHIGMVSLFSDRPLEVDMYGCDVLSQFGFWPEDVSPVRSVKRLGPADVITVGPDDQVHVHRYASDEEFYGYREAEPDVDAVAASLAVLTGNAGEIAQQSPVVHLSGGQDSRVTAAAWVAGGKPATIQTLGTLQGEVDIAEQLVAALEPERSLEDRGITHNITVPNRASLSTFSIEDRLQQAMLMWDGDFAPGNLKAAIRRPPARNRLTIGGANGEVMHGIYYSTESILKIARGLDHPVRRVGAAFPGRANTERSRPAAMEFLEHQIDFTRRLGQHDATALNVFQMHSKFRRWINAQLSAGSFILLLNPVFVRAGMDLTPEQRLGKVMQKALSRALVPQWEDVPYYKANFEESTTASRTRGIRTWDTSPGSLERLLEERTAWQEWFPYDVIADILEKVRAGEANGAHESTLNKAYVLDAIPDHVGALEQRRHSALSRV